MPAGIFLENHFLSFEEIKERSDYSDFSAYLENSLLFCHNWLNGLEEFVIQTSGSTGNPKSIHLSRKQLLASAHATAKVLSLDSTDKGLVCLNTEYIGGKMMLIRCMVIGMNAQLVKPTSDPFVTVFDNDITFFSFAPLQLEAIVANGHLERIQRGKALIIGGGTLNASLEQLIKKIDIPSYHTFGMTETASHIALRSINGSSKTTSYQALDGVTLGVDSRNCLHITAAQTGDKTIQTNDMVELVGENKFIWKGRIDEIINTGGIKVFIPELEENIRAYIEKHTVATCYFISHVPDDVLGQKIILVLEGLINENKNQDLLAGLKNILPNYHDPKEIYVLKKFPVTPSGKINKKAVLKILNDL